MKVVFKTNLDQYKTNCFPTNITHPPRKGDKVMVTEVFGEYFLKQKLPVSLEVVDVVWTEYAVVCELWYNKVDLEICKSSGAKPFG